MMELSGGDIFFRRRVFAGKTGWTQNISESDLKPDESQLVGVTFGLFLRCSQQC
jgi:hypothetical protein